MNIFYSVFFFLVPVEGFLVDDVFLVVDVFFTSLTSYI